MSPKALNDPAALWQALSEHLASAQDALLCAQSERFLLSVEAARRVAAGIVNLSQLLGPHRDLASLPDPVLAVRHHVLVLAALLRRHQRYLSTLQSLLATPDGTYRPQGS